MNKKRIGVLFFILLTLLISLTAINATKDIDENDSVLSDHEVNNIEKNTTLVNKENPKNIKMAKSNIYVSPNGNDKATGSNNNPYKTITKAITSANNNDEIILKDGTYIITNVGRVDINKNITIKSNNKQKVTIQAKTSVNDLFFINPSNSLSISNVQFKNINRCSVFANKGKLTLTNVDFISNGVNNNGNNKKAIVNNYGTLTMNKCYFEKNRGYNGSAVYNVATATITNSNIRNGNALFGGAIYSHYGTVIIKNSNITANTVNGSEMDGWDSDSYVYTGGLGGAIFNRATMQIHNTILQYNKIPEGQYHVQFGGTIANYGKLLLNNSRVLNTYAMGSGAIYNSHTLNVYNSVINNNLAEHHGGAILNNGYATIINTTINRNQGFYSVITNNYQMQINNSIINTNNATVSLIRNNYNLKMNNITGMFNTAANGGFIYNLARLTLLSSKLTQNNGDCGGAIEDNGEYTLIDKCFLNSNKANSSGGAINCQDANITVTSTQFNSNTAVSSGGAISTSNSIFAVRSSTFNGNKVDYNFDKSTNYEYSDSYGGALCINGGTTKIIDSLINYNIADCGGAIAIFDGTVYMNVTNIYSNTAKNVGGAISTYSEENDYKPYMKLYKINIKYNYAKNGGHAISDDALAYGLTIDITSSNINNNGKTSNTEFDDVLVLSGIVTMNDVQIKYNNASVLWSCANLTIKNSMISGNIKNNGEMIGYYGKTIITNSRIRDNICKHVFSTYVGQFDGKLTIDKSTIYNPKAKYEIYNDYDSYYSSTSNVKCDNNWWGTQTKPTNRVYKCKINTFNKGLR